VQQVQSPLAPGVRAPSPPPRPSRNPAPPRGQNTPPCPSRTMSPITVDTEKDQSYPLGDVLCSLTPSPPPATAERHATELEVWTEVDWAGLRIKRCAAVGAVAPPAR
jgi:hypothetical protein